MFNNEEKEYTNSLTIGERIKYYRERAGLSMDELAEKTNYKTRSAIHNLESNRCQLPITKLSLMASVLGVSVDDLLGSNNDEIIAKKKDNEYSTRSYDLSDISIPEQMDVCYLLDTIVNKYKNGTAEKNIVFLDLSKYPPTKRMLLKNIISDVIRTVDEVNIWIEHINE